MTSRKPYILAAMTWLVLAGPVVAQRSGSSALPMLRAGQWRQVTVATMALRGRRIHPHELQGQFSSCVPARPFSLRKDLGDDADCSVRQVSASTFAIACQQMTPSVQATTNITLAGDFSSKFDIRISARMTRKGETATFDHDTVWTYVGACRRGQSPN